MNHRVSSNWELRSRNYIALLKKKINQQAKKTDVETFSWRQSLSMNRQHSCKKKSKKLNSKSIESFIRKTFENKLPNGTYSGKNEKIHSVF